MVPNKSLDKLVETELIIQLLTDARAFVEGFNDRALRLTQRWVERRVRDEGLGFLTKTLPSLGKHFDQVLAGACSLNPTKYAFPCIRGSKLPRFLGELFKQVCSLDGTVLPDPNAKCVGIIRQILYCFYKYKLAHSPSQIEKVIAQFVKTEDDLAQSDAFLRLIGSGVQVINNTHLSRRLASRDQITKEENFVGACSVVRQARILLNRVLSGLDLRDVIPRHGPGVVSTKEKLWEKFRFTNVASKITDVYPLDEYFYASLGHVCDRQSQLMATTSNLSSAEVKLVPKDSRGPRIISCEPLDFQWIQQGIRRALYERVESHQASRFNVFFTNQQPNQLGALLGSKKGNYATLDLKEASDRVSLELVRLLFPEWCLPFLEAARSETTRLPDGRVLKLRKYAPMGSALCFPVMALCIWSILSSHAPNKETREGILVYGDDVIVPMHYASRAITALETFGLMVNRDKSCYHNGLFRESCGMDAFNGVPVVPVRFRTVWSELPSGSHYASWIAYANELYRRGWHSTYRKLVDKMLAVYGPIPGKDMPITGCPILEWSPSLPSEFRRRWNKNLQKWEFKVRTLKARRVIKTMDGWSMLLRYFTEGSRALPDMFREEREHERSSHSENRDQEAFSASQYTPRHTTNVVKRWR